MDSEPLPENIDGHVLEQHTWNHNIDHSIRWDYVLLAVAAVVVAYLLFGRSRSAAPENDEGAGGASGPDPFSS